MKTHADKVGIWGLLIAAVITIILWQIPLGAQILYPFTILATWFHEMGHGLAAVLLGGEFAELKLYANGSGVASYRIAPDHLSYAFIAASGPLAPAIAGSIFIFAGRFSSSAHYCLLLLSLMLLFSALIWVRSGFGIGMLLILSGSIFLIALQASHALQQFAIQFLGVQACISTFRQLDYLLTREVVIGGKGMLSDTGQIAEYLFLPHYIWGWLIIISALIILLISLKAAYR
jgi:hypothetical protein